jgi:hypothetical protein
LPLHFFGCSFKFLVDFYFFDAIAVTTIAIVIITSSATVAVAVVVSHCHRCHVGLSLIVVVFRRLCHRPLCCFFSSAAVISF